jgi:hypothetical protein
MSPTPGPEPPLGADATIAVRNSRSAIAVAGSYPGGEYVAVWKGVMLLAPSFMTIEGS